MQSHFLPTFLGKKTHRFSGFVAAITFTRFFLFRIVLKHSGLLLQC